MSNVQHVCWSCPYLTKLTHLCGVAAGLYSHKEKLPCIKKHDKENIRHQFNQEEQDQKQWFKMIPAGETYHGKLQDVLSSLFKTHFTSLQFIKLDDLPIRDQKIFCNDLPRMKLKELILYLCDAASFAGPYIYYILEQKDIASRKHVYFLSYRTKKEHKHE